MTEKTSKAKGRASGPAEFAGRIESITAGAEFRFAVAAKKAGVKMFAIAGAEPAQFAAMTALVTSSYLAGKKIHVTGMANGNSVTIASEVRIGAKPKAARGGKAFPKNSKPPAATEAANAPQSPTA
jgi:hypothetical protein